MSASATRVFFPPTRKSFSLSSLSTSDYTHLEELLDKYKDYGIYEIGKAEILRLDPFPREYGKPQKISQLFGGKAGYLKAVQELEDEIYRVG